MKLQANKAEFKAIRKELQALHERATLAIGSNNPPMSLLSETPAELAPLEVLFLNDVQDKFYDVQSALHTLWTLAEE